jgi:muramoyltetrapeptide carboxypeptidase
VVGGMSDMRDNLIPFGKTAQEIILHTVAEYNFPICFDFPCGHIHDNRAILLGREIHLTVAKNKVTLTFNQKSAPTL